MTDPLAGLYQELILDHSRRRIGDGPLDAFSAERHEHNPTCGDDITVQVLTDVAADRLVSIGWHGDGCSISMASASVMAEMLPGMTADEVRLRADAFREMLRSRGAIEPDEDLLGDAIAFRGVGKYVMRVKCAMLPWVALEGCLAEVAG